MSSVLNRSSNSSYSAPDTTVKLPSIKDFTIIKPISRGAFGKVFLCHKNEKPDKIFAVKVMKKKVMVNKNMMKQVLTERDALALSRSPFVVQLFYSMQSKNSIYLVMEYMIGGDIKSLLSIYGFFDEEMAIFYAAEAAHALEYLHQHNIVHRDLKPDNMLISACGHIKLTDFGLSKITINRPINLKDLMGSPSCYYDDTEEGLPNRTPGQLLSLTSAIGFSCHKNKLNFAESGSPFFEEDVGHRQLSASDSINALHNRPLEGTGSYSSSIASPLALNFETPDKLLKSDHEKMSYDSSGRKKLERNDSFGSNSSHGSCSSYTPYYPKEKRKILTARSTKNLREMKSQSNLTSPDFSNSKLKRIGKRKQSLDSGFEKVKVKRKRSFSPDGSSDLRPLKKSTGLSAVLSDLRFNRQRVFSEELNPCRVQNLSPTCDKNVSGDNVFLEPTSSEGFSALNCQSEIPNTQSLVYSSPSQSLCSSFTEEELPKKTVNFCFNSVGNRTNHTDNLFLSDINTSYASELNTSKSVFCTPTERQTKCAWTPLQITQTPFRTPKSVRRGPEPQSNERILGTPDYLAPELLLHKEHSFPVDWWALGVCLFEFLTGIPPFNDTTAEAVFNNILNRDIPWPENEEALSETAKNAIDLLLTSEASLRPGVKELKTWPLFENIEWENILHIKAPFIPVPDSNTDTTYFDARNEAQHIKVSSFDL